MKTKRALITGVAGQDGSYLAELLLSRGYEVHGTVRPDAPAPDPRVPAGVRTHVVDFADARGLDAAVDAAAPDEVYHLAALSSVRESFEKPVLTSEINALGTLRLLETLVRAGARSRFLYSASSEMYGGPAPSGLLDELSPFRPRSPYACSKVFSYWNVVNHRERFGAHASNAILFNHESPRRPDGFVTRKITRAVARIVAGRQDTLNLGNVDARRDWGWAPDYVEAMTRVLAQPRPGDFVIATGRSHSIRDFLDEAFGSVGLDWEKHVRGDTTLYRPSDVHATTGDATKARRLLGWSPTVGFEELVRRMVRADLEAEGVDPARCADPARRAA